MKRKKEHNIEVVNRKAYHDYDILEEIEAGVVLLGGEIKSIRNGNVSIKESYCYVSGSTMWLKNTYIKLYENAGFIKYEEKRDRVLLLRKREIEHIRKFVEAKGYASVPLKMYINSRGLCKVIIGLCKGRHSYDKKKAIEDRDAELDTKREILIHYAN